MQLALTTQRAGPRVGPIFARGIKLRCQRVVELVEHLGNPQLRRLANRRREIAPEAGQEIFVITSARADVIQLPFEVRGEFIANIGAEEIQQEDGDNPAFILWNQAVLVFADIFAILNRRHDRRIGGRPANAQFFHFLDQRRLGITRRGLGEVLLGRDVLLGDRVALHDLGQALVVVIDHVIAPFLIHPQEAVKRHHLACGAQHNLTIVRGQIDRGTLQPCGFHLAGQRALPDQIIKLALIRIGQFQAGGIHAHIRGADTFVRFLRILGLVLVDARAGGHVGVAIPLANRLARGGHGLGGHVDAVGPHIGDVPGLIETLRGGHGLPCAHTELAARFLLQGRRHERRRGVARGGLGLDAAGCEVARLHRGHGDFGRSGVGQIEFFELLAAMFDQTRLKALTARRFTERFDRPVFLRVKGLDLHLAFNDQPQADRLHTPGGFRARQFAPQNG